MFKNVDHSCLFSAQYEQGIGWSKKAIEIDNSHPLLARAEMALGIGISMHAMEVKSQAERTTAYKDALKAFKK